MEHFVQMARNNAWANEVLYGAVDGLKAEEVWAARPGFFGSIGRTLNHIHEVDLYYIDALEQGGLGRSVYEREDLRSMVSLGAAQARADARFIVFCEGLDPDTLTREVPTERKGETVAERTDWLILHLVQHQVHHRGQVHTMLSHAGVDPPQLDDFYLRFGRVPSAQSYWED